MPGRLMSSRTTCVGRSGGWRSSSSTELYRPTHRYPGVPSISAASPSRVVLSSSTIATRTGSGDDASPRAPFTGDMLAPRSHGANRMNMRVRHRHIDDDAGAATLGERLDPSGPAKCGRPAPDVLESLTAARARRTVACLRVETDPVVGHFDTEASL